MCGLSFFADVSSPPVSSSSSSVMWSGWLPADSASLSLCRPSAGAAWRARSHSAADPAARRRSWAGGGRQRAPPRPYSDSAPQPGPEFPPQGEGPSPSQHVHCSRSQASCKKKNNKKPFKPGNLFISWVNSLCSYCLFSLLLLFIYISIKISNQIWSLNPRRMTDWRENADL